MRYLLSSNLVSLISEYMCVEFQEEKNLDCLNNICQTFNYIMKSTKHKNFRLLLKDEKIYMVSKARMQRKDDLKKIQRIILSFQKSQYGNKVNTRSYPDVHHKLTPIIESQEEDIQ